MNFLIYYKMIYISKQQNKERDYDGNTTIDIITTTFCWKRLEKIWWIFTHFIDCVSNFHESGYFIFYYIIHGDLKPMNVLIISKRNTKLIDVDLTWNILENQYLDKNILHFIFLLKIIMKWN